MPSLTLPRCCLTSRMTRPQTPYRACHSQPEGRAASHTVGGFGDLDDDENVDLVSTQGERRLKNRPPRGFGSPTSVVPAAPGRLRRTAVAAA